MQRFKKLLVGIDLAGNDRLVAKELMASDAEVVKQAKWLAKLNAASIDFLYTLDISAKTEHLVTDAPNQEHTVLQKAEEQLAGLVEDARREDIVARGRVVIGKSWLELIRQTLREGHDLVMVGTHHLSSWQGFFMGSTTIKLLRKCPVPVWVVQIPNEKEVRSILVPHDLLPAGSLALELGCSRARYWDAQLHVLHCVEPPRSIPLFGGEDTHEEIAKLSEDAWSQIDGQLSALELPKPAHVHITEQRPEVAITNYIDHHGIDLVVMGTVNRTGITGLISGDTAEVVLPRISCSLLAVKPPGFVTPVQLE